MSVMNWLKSLKRNYYSPYVMQYDINRNIRMFNKNADVERNMRNILVMKDIHKNKRGFIICNGPSLSADDLTKIHDNGDISIASNKIDMIFGRTQWRPTYYTVFDYSYARTLLDTMNKMECEQMFFPIDSYRSTGRVKRDNIVWLNTNNPNEKVLFSEDLTQYIHPWFTVTYSMIQILNWMGIKEMYIIGCDNSYAKTKNEDGSITTNNHSSHFEGYASKKKDKTMAVAIHELDKAYFYARDYADKHGIKIYNATRGGYLEAFERVNFDNLFLAT